MTQVWDISVLVDDVGRILEVRGQAELHLGQDGRGMIGDRSGTGFGMTSMRERAERIGASLTFVTAPRAGTEVVLAWQPASFSIPGAEHADQ